MRRAWVVTRGGESLLAGPRRGGWGLRTWLALALALAALIVSLAVLVPVLSSTRLVALPLPHRLHRPRLIAVLPAQGQGQGESRLRLLPLNSSAHWADFTLWKEEVRRLMQLRHPHKTSTLNPSYGAWRIVVPVVGLTLALLAIAVCLIRRHHYSLYHHELSDHSLKTNLLGEISEEE